MSKIIKEYYSKVKVMPLLLETKLSKFDKNPDIATEFEYWIVKKQYKETHCVVVEGYTAKNFLNYLHI